MEESRIGYWLMSGIALGLVALVWFVIRKMIDDLWKDFKDMKKTMRDKMDVLEKEIHEKFRINEKDREVLKEIYLRGDYHKVFCAATQDRFLLHVSKENKKLSDTLLLEIKNNRETVFNAITDLRSDMKSNGHMK